MFLLSFSKLSWISYFVFIATNWKTADLCCRLWNNGNKGLKLPDDYFGQTKYFYSGISWHFVMKFMFSDFIACVPTLDCISEAKYFVQLLYCRFFLLRWCFLLEWFLYVWEWLGNDQILWKLVIQELLQNIAKSL